MSTDTKTLSERLRTDAADMSVRIAAMYRQVGRDCAEAADALDAKDALLREAVAALKELANAKALSGVRELVAGWNGENRPEGPFAERHPDRLGATLPKTNCGAIYALDEAIVRARLLLSKLTEATKS